MRRGRDDNDVEFEPAGGSAACDSRDTLAAEQFAESGHLMAAQCTAQQ